MLAVQWGQAPPEWLRPLEQAVAQIAPLCQPHSGAHLLRLELLPAAAAIPRIGAPAVWGLAPPVPEVAVAGVPAAAAGAACSAAPARPVLDTAPVRWLQRRGLYIWALASLLLAEAVCIIFFPGGRSVEDCGGSAVCVQAWRHPQASGELAMEAWAMCTLACCAWFLLAHRLSSRQFVKVVTSFECLALVATVMLASAAGLHASFNVANDAGDFTAESWFAEVTFAALVHCPLAVFVGAMDALEVRRAFKGVAMVAATLYWCYCFARACSDAGGWFDREDTCFLVEPMHVRNVYLILVLYVVVFHCRLLLGLVIGCGGGAAAPMEADTVPREASTALEDDIAWGDLEPADDCGGVLSEDQNVAMHHTVSHDIVYSLRSSRSSLASASMHPTASSLSARRRMEWPMDRAGSSSLPPMHRGGRSLYGSDGSVFSGTQTSSPPQSEESTLTGLLFMRNLSIGKPPEPTKLVVISDLGQDNDDEMALMLMSELAQNDEVEPLAVVANLRPSGVRAALARGTLDMLGLHQVPVGIGSDGGSQKHTDTFSEYISEGKTGVDYLSGPMKAVERLQAAEGTSEQLAISKECRIYNGQWLLCDVLAKAPVSSITLVLLSSMKDAAQLLREHEQLFVAKVKCVAIMGGVDSAAVHSGEAGSRRLLPDEMAHNNCFDLPAAKFLYARCQELGVPLVVLSRFAAYGCPVRRHVYDLMVRCQVPNPVICRLHQAQRASIERLWGDVCVGNKLPARCDRKWFCDTFCKGNGYDRGSNDSMWDLVETFNMYDPLALLAALPRRRDVFFEQEEFRGPDGTVHLVIGTGTEQNGISPVHAEDLHEFLMSIWIRSAGRPREGQSAFAREADRPRELDSEGLTAALNPMKVHKAEELVKIRQSVLRLLDDEWPKMQNSSLLSTWQKRDHLMRDIGPPMMLLHWETVNTLRRIPHSEEGYAITLEKAFQIAKKHKKRFFIEMFSHRWCSRYAPDDCLNSKAAVLVEWAKYRWSSGLGTFFWVDYTCVDQNDIDPGVSMLPLYVSSCNNIICYDTPEYEPRAWCRVERLLFAAFVAPNNEFISPDFVFHEHAERLASNELKPQVEEQAVLPDPDEGDLSFPRDKALIQEIKSLCVSHWGKCWKAGLMDSCLKRGNTADKLCLGETQVRLRRFTGQSAAGNPAPKGWRRAAAEAAGPLVTLA